MVPVVFVCWRDVHIKYRYILHHVNSTVLNVTHEWFAEIVIESVLRIISCFGVNECVTVH